MFIFFISFSFSFPFRSNFFSNHLISVFLILVYVVLLQLLNLFQPFKNICISLQFSVVLRESFWHNFVVSIILLLFSIPYNNFVWKLPIIYFSSSSSCFSSSLTLLLLLNLLWCFPVLLRKADRSEQIFWHMGLELPLLSLLKSNKNI